MFLYTV
jgi:hypothetical protein